jgi:hypothetical protein
VKSVLENAASSDPVRWDDEELVVPLLLSASAPELVVLFV